MKRIDMNLPFGASPGCRAYILGSGDTVIYEQLFPKVIQPRRILTYVHVSSRSFDEAYYRSKFPAVDYFMDMPNYRTGGTWYIVVSNTEKLTEHGYLKLHKVESIALTYDGVDVSASAKIRPIA